MNFNFQFSGAAWLARRLPASEPVNVALDGYVAPEFSEAARNGRERMECLDGLSRSGQPTQSGQCPESCCSKRYLIGPSAPDDRGTDAGGSCPVPSRTGQDDYCRFEDLAIGDCFTVQFLPGVYFKTGLESYGIAPGEPEWDLAGLATNVVRKCPTGMPANVTAVNFSEFPEAA